MFGEGKLTTESTEDTEERRGGRGTGDQESLFAGDSVGDLGV